MNTAVFIHRSNFLKSSQSLYSKKKLFENEMKFALYLSINKTYLNTNLWDQKIVQQRGVLCTKDF